MRPPQLRSVSIKRPGYCFSCRYYNLNKSTVNPTKFLLTIFLLVNAFLLANCTYPRLHLIEVTETATAQPPATPTEITAPLLPPTELGLAENPLILALPPSANTPQQIDAAKMIASQFTERTGYSVVTVVPDSYSALVDALENGNAHIVLLDSYAYELAYQKDWVRASYAVLKDEQGTYGAQFLATRKGGFTSYFDQGVGENTENETIALTQFAG